MLSSTEKTEQDGPPGAEVQQLNAATRVDEAAALGGI